MRGAGNTIWAIPLTPELIGAILLFVGPVVVGIVVIAWAARRCKRPPAERLTAEEELARYRALKDAGELSPKEFERIRAQLSERRKEEG